MTPYIAVAALVLLGLAVALLAYVLAGVGAPAPPDVGMRGLKRSAALAGNAGFALVEPVMRFLAGRAANLPLEGLRERIRRQLLHAGEYLGLTPDEYIGLSVLSGGMFLGVGVAATFLLPGQIPGVLVALLAALGCALPYLQVQAEVDRRYKQVNRGLPFAIDLASLAMGAGLDFPASLRQITDKTADKSDALYEELSRILAELDLGRTRAQALTNFAERCPTESVRDFVASVVQSEAKGNPLAEVLSLQATSLRMRRSIAAEEAAARASVLIIGPLMLIFAAIMLIILGPFVIKTINNEGL